MKKKLTLRWIVVGLRLYVFPPDPEIGALEALHNWRPEKKGIIETLKFRYKTGIWSYKATIISYNKNRMLKTSLKQAAKDRKVASIKKRLPLQCAICGRPSDDAAHLLPKSMYPEYYTEEWNIVRLCRTCHNLYDNNIQFRKSQTRLREVVSEHDPLAANRYFKL